MNMKYRPTKKQKGLTLIELLVTMVILGFVISTMSGALAQISHMVRITTQQSNGFLGRWTQSRALFDIVNNMVIDPTLDLPFRGSTQQLELTSLISLDGSLDKPSKFRLELQIDKAKVEPTTQVIIMVMDTQQQSESKQRLLAQFKGRLEWRFVDQSGREHRQWPVTGGQQNQALPIQIMLRDTENQQASVRIAGHSGNINPSTAMSALFSTNP
jgi:prepilin-type N-terminal cleavage/methylation domain-containing protein